MGIYIKDKELPEGCNVCCFGIWYPNSNRMFACKILEESFVYYRGTGRFVDCPLVEVKEPHGRLIDADKIKAAYGEWYTEEGTEEGFIGTVGSLIDLIPTVIEGEKGE